MKFIKYLVIFYCVLLCSPVTTFAQSLPIKPTSNPENTTMIKKVLLVVAMDTEAAPIIKSLGLQQIPLQNTNINLPMQYYAGKYLNLDIFMVINGKDPRYHVQNIGTQAATLATYLGINQFHPDLVISIGTAGGLQETGARIHDIYLSKKIYFFDHRIPGKFQQYAWGDYSSAILTGLNNLNHLKTGIICSGNSFDNNKTDARIIKQEGCNAIDMEAAAVAWVSQLTKTPMIAVKGITDYKGASDDFQQFTANFAVVTDSLAINLQQILNHIAATSN